MEGALEDPVVNVSRGRVKALFASEAGQGVDIDRPPVGLEEYSEGLCGVRGCLEAAVIQYRFLSQGLGLRLWDLASGNTYRPDRLK